MSTPLPYLSDDEVAGICEPLTMPAAQCRHLTTLGLLVKRKPNGRPLVARSEFERVLGALRMDAAKNDPTRSPNVTALREHLEKRKHGPRT